MLGERDPESGPRMLSLILLGALLPPPSDITVSFPLYAAVSVSEPALEFGAVDFRFFLRPVLVGADNDGTLAGEIGLDGCGVGCVEDVDM